MSSVIWQLPIFSYYSRCAHL